MSVLYILELEYYVNCVNLEDVQVKNDSMRTNKIEVKL
jgi:hypothetical protein